MASAGGRNSGSRLRHPGETAQPGNEEVVWHLSDSAVGRRPRLRHSVHTPISSPLPHAYRWRPHTALCAVGGITFRRGTIGRLPPLSWPYRMTRTNFSVVCHGEKRKGKVSGIAVGGKTQIVRAARPSSRRSRARGRQFARHREKLPDRSKDGYHVQTTDATNRWLRDFGCPQLDGQWHVVAIPRIATRT